MDSEVLRDDGNHTVKDGSDMLGPCAGNVLFLLLQAASLPKTSHRADDAGLEGRRVSSVSGLLWVPRGDVMNVQIRSAQQGA